MATEQLKYAIGDYVKWKGIIPEWKDYGVIHYGRIARIVDNGPLGLVYLMSDDSWEN